MKFLLDTNVVIWSLSNPGKLTPRARSILAEPQIELIVSLVSLWELAIKIGKGKLTTVGSSIHYVVDELREQRIDLLPVTIPHLFRLEYLDPLHNDPFDRILIAQALAENLPIITADRIFASYGIDVLW